jgi:hypothetical protein
MHHFLAVPVFDTADSYRTTDAQDIIAVACLKKAIVRVPIALRKLELRRTLAVGIDGLFLVKIDAISHQLGLYGYTVVMELMVGVHVRTIGPFADGVTMAHLLPLIEHGITGTKRIRLGADTPERGRYSRGAARE